MIYLTWDPIAMRCDWSATGNPLETAILLALFTDLAATPDYKPLDGDPRGHWSDAYTGQPTGSSLWQLDHSKMTTQALDLARDTAQRALQPLIDAGVANTISVEAQKQGPLGQLCAMRITVTAPDGTVNSFRYAWAWQGI